MPEAALRWPGLESMKQQPVLSEQELAQLRAIDWSYREARDTRWFWIRSLFCLAYIAAMAIALTVFPERVYARFDFPVEIREAVFETYTPMRIATLILCSAIYFLSYVKRWNFPYVALTAFVIAAYNLLGDYVTIYVYARPDTMMALSIILGIRLLLLASLFLNFLFSIRPYANGRRLP